MTRQFSRPASEAWCSSTKIRSSKASSRVAERTGIAAALIEKDYWVTHTLWALHRTGLDIGFKLIHRFSEDLDLMIEQGTVSNLPAVPSWTSTNRGRVAARQSFYDALVGVLVIPGARVERDQTTIDKRARVADYLCRYPGRWLGAAEV